MTLSLLFALALTSLAPSGRAGVPRIDTTIQAHATLHRGDILEFTVTATWSRSLPLELTLLDPPAGCIFTQDGLPNAAPSSGATGHGRWRVPKNIDGLHHLHFRAVDRVHGVTIAERAVPVQIVGSQLGAHTTLVFGDVTGDGVLDTVGRAVNADRAQPDVGAIYVWSGTAAPTGIPDATLVVAGAKQGDKLGDGPFQAVQLADVTGDGVLDVVGVALSADRTAVKKNQGAIYVWAGGATMVGAPSPVATLIVSNAADNDFLGLGSGQSVQLADVTGDHVPDVVAQAPLADVGGVVDTGAIYVWQGGAAMAGTPAPVATLTVPGAVAGDSLGVFPLGGYPLQGVGLADVTGDRVLDVVGIATDADVAGVVDAGAIYVWEGGATLSGAPAARATLTIPGATANDQLGFGMGQSVLFADVNGDAVIDVVANAFLADVGLVQDAGAIYVWSGGATLVGAPAPLATLTVPGAVAVDALGTATDQGLLLADVTGDGRLDVIASASEATVGGVSRAGAIYVWKGGPSLAGAAPPLATLTVPGASTNDNLGAGGNVEPARLVQLEDVSGDGVLDVVAGAPSATVAGTPSVGAIYLWKGGATLSGALAPFATMTVPGAAANSWLGSFADAEGLLLVDVTGDGVRDVVAGAPYADVAGVVDAGEVYVWRGGAALAGAVAPAARLSIPAAVASDRLGGGGGGYGQSIEAADVTGDAVLDLVVGAALADRGGVGDAGAVFVWEGGATLVGAAAPLATLEAAGASAGDSLAYEIRIADVTGDRRLDVVVASPNVDQGTQPNAGRGWVWAGGAALAGAPSPSATLDVASGVTNDQLLSGGLGLAEVTGDGSIDLVIGAARADFSSIVNVGLIYLWAGGPTLTGSPPQLSRFRVPGAKANDMLGL